MDEVRNYMSRALSTISSQATALEASKHMAEGEIGSLLVEEEGEYLGMVTEVDLNRQVMAAERDPGSTPVSSIMSQPLITMDSGQTMNDALLMMSRKNIRHLLITEDEKIVGIISVKDFGSYYRKRFGLGKDPISEFWANHETLIGETSYLYAVKKLVKDFRKTLPDTSKIAKSIDNNDHRETIAQFAEEEGQKEFAKILRMAAKYQSED